MSTFTPPGRTAVPPTLPYDGADQTPLGRRLFRHYRSRPEGINVYMLSDGSITEEDPDGEAVVWSRGDKAGAVYVTQAWYGGHDDYNLTDAQATALTDAGYTITP